MKKSSWRKSESTNLKSDYSTFRATYQFWAKVLESAVEVEVQANKRNDSDSDCNW